MKTRNKLLGLIAIAIIATAATALSMTGCDGDDTPTEEQPFATTYDLKLGDIKITLNYKKKASEPVPAYIAQLQIRFNSMATLASNNVEPSVSVVKDLKNRGGDYSINVIYGDNNSFVAFRATDGQTLEAHNSWLSANAETTTSAQLAAAFQAMLAL